MRGLGLDLATVIRVLDRTLSLGDVVALHTAPLDAQIRIQRLRRAVLRAVAKRTTTLETMELMHNLAKLSEEERNRILADFHDEVFGGLDIDPAFEERMRSVTRRRPPLGRGRRSPGADRRRPAGRGARHARAAGRDR